MIKTKITAIINKTIKVILIIILSVIIALIAYFIENKEKNEQWNMPPLEPPFQSGIQATIYYYSHDVEKLSTKYNLPYSYLMALIMLETSGEYLPKSRFEKHVYHKLKSLRDGKLSKYEDITQQDIQNLDNKTLKELATSWGPFQIMGYKSIKMNIPVNELYGDKALEYGVQWINKEYGYLLRQGRFADAFHYHNTGHIIPKNGKKFTTDPYYVDKGLKLMKTFKQLAKEQ